MELEDVRTRINAMTTQIIIPLKYRSRLPLNCQFYETQAPRFSQDGIPDSLVRFYADDILPDLCRRHSNGYSFENAPYLDGQILGLFYERVKIGEEVAKIKLERMPELAGMTDRESLKNALRDPGREEEVVAAAKRAAMDYDVDTYFIGNVFRELMDRTLDTEVDYIMAARTYL